MTSILISFYTGFVFLTVRKQRETGKMKRVIPWRAIFIDCVTFLTIARTPHSRNAPKSRSDRLSMKSWKSPSFGYMIRVMPQRRRNSLINASLLSESPVVLVLL